jgi:uncharacterized protein YjiK
MTTFKLIAEYATPDIAEPSAIAISPYGFIVADDESGLHLVERPGKRATAVASTLVDGGDLKNAEGVAYDRERSSILALTEKGVVREYRVKRAKAGLHLADGTRLGRLPSIGKKKAGWEGLGVLPAARAPDGGDHLLAVHERKPLLLGVFRRDTLEVEAEIEVPSEVRGHEIHDLSDLTVDPRTRHVLLLSDESRAVFGFELRHRARGGVWTIQFVSWIPLPALVERGRLQPEGLDFDERGDLWIACDQGQRLLQLRRARGSAA